MKLKAARFQTGFPFALFSQGWGFVGVFESIPTHPWPNCIRVGKSCFFALSLNTKNKIPRNGFGWDVFLDFFLRTFFNPFVVPRMKPFFKGGKTVLTLEVSVL
jgi:hypothetical protein